MLPRRPFDGLMERLHAYIALGSEKRSFSEPRQSRPLEG